MMGGCCANLLPLLGKETAAQVPGMEAPTPMRNVETNFHTELVVEDKVAVFGNT